MKLPVALVALAITLAFKSQGQQDSPIDWNHDGFSIFISGGGGGTLSQSMSLNAFRTLMPESELLNQDWSQFNNLSSSHSEFQNGFSFGAWLPAGTRADGSSRNGRFLLGISYINYKAAGLILDRETRTRIDTLVSATTGSSLFVDQIHSQNLSAEIRFYSLGLDVGYLFHSDWDSRWMAYGGAIVSIGAVLQANASVSYYENNRTQPTVDHGTDEWSSDNFQREKETLSGGFSAALQTPIGIDFRLSRKHAFWSNLSLYWEWRPSLRAAAVSGVDSNLTPGMVTLFGMRIRGF